ncbi:MAG: PorT family protein [Bacteroidales bacterium]|nr:PorT family protein [Bacteroidales bacterium]
MKRILILSALMVAFLVPAVAQEKEEKLKELEELEQQTEKRTPPDTIVAAAEDTLAVIMAEEEEIAVVVSEDAGDTSRVRIGEIVTIEDTGDETVIRIGKKAIKILDDDNDTSITWEEEEDYEGVRHTGQTRRSFDGHLGGLEFGFNGYSTGRWMQNETPLENYLDLNTAKSTNFNIVSPPVSLGFTRHFGLVTALGVNFNSYRFDGNVTLGVDDDGMIAPVYPAEPIRFEKSKLATVYGFIPVLLELQIPVNHGGTINLGAGVIGAVKLGSHTKVVYYDDGKQKDKNHDDFNLNVLRYGVTARAGYEMVHVYGTFYLSPMFEDNRGPELYPFEVGLALTIND